MTAMLFREDAYQAEATGTVMALTEEGGVVLDETVFYPTGGGQPGDAGWLTSAEGELAIAGTVKGEQGAIVLIPAEAATLPSVGQEVVQRLDWVRRHKHMRVHTALHLLSVVVPFGVTGGQISADYGRIDFDMPEAPENRDDIEAALNAYVAQDLRVTESWITGAALDANPQLVKTMSVQPPRTGGDIRLIQIGDGAAPVDLQPCGGTHVARTGEIGALRLGKVQKKGRMNRRVYVHLEN